jgi:NADH-ubiquinone oxidoreductase chain 5
MLLSLLVILFLGFITCQLFGYRLGGKGCCIITIWCVYLATVFSEMVFFNTFFFHKTYKLILGDWIVLDNTTIFWNFCFDNITSSMLIVVTFISFFVHVYSSDYMSLDPHLPRFVSYLSLFTLFMLFLVTANNFLILFIGWEGVGLCSFLLINFWHTRIQANKAAIKAILFNRVGDFFLLFAMFILYYVFNSLDYDIIFSESACLTGTSLLLNDTTSINCIDLICFSLFIGAVGKSAQLGLHTWLPDAMEGPTPVSALIHAATMVTAGVFLLIRGSFLFEHAPNILFFISIVGALTAVFAATTGLFQNDIKRIIAYSTCSQLGYMVFACGLSNYQVGFFHLSNHAFFKALLFLGAGSIIHAIADEQDIRKMGGFKNLLPFAYGIFLIGSLALIGFPFLSGFYSKDIILENAFAHYNNAGVYIFWLGLFGAMCTAFYSIRLLLLVFLTKTKTYRIVLLNIHEGHFAIFIPLFFLAIFSIFSGYMSADFFTGFGTDYWNNVIFILPQNYFLYDIEFISFYKGLPLLFVFLGIIIAVLCCTFFNKMFYNFKTTTSFKVIYNFLIKKWYFDRLYNEIIGQQLLMFSYFFAYKNLDRGFIELFGPTSVTDILYNTTMFVKNVQSGYIYHYVNFFILGLFCIILFVIGFSVILTKIIFILNLIFMLLLSESVIDYLTKY